MKYILIILFTILIGCGGGGGDSGASVSQNDTPAVTVLSDTNTDTNSSTTDNSKTEDKTGVLDESIQLVPQTPSVSTCEATCTLRHPKILTGKVVSVTDGDTIKILTNDYKTYEVRLLYIDAPERGQDFSKAAKKVLADMVFNKTVKILYEKHDKYGRILGEVYLGNKLINKEMVRQGLAWVYRTYCYDAYYLRLEADARDKFSGLWSQPNPIPPWAYRKDHEAAKETDFTYLYKVEIPVCETPEEDTPTVNPPTIQPTQQPTVTLPKTGQLVNPDSKPKKNEQNPHYTCGVKRYCKQMDSCEEAYFYLRQCGLQRLDGDHDGVPCEALCR